MQECTIHCVCQDGKMVDRWAMTHIEIIHPDLECHLVRMNHCGVPRGYL